MPRRHLALCLPRLATDRLTRANPSLAGRRLVAWQVQANRHVLVAVNELAAHELSPGMTLADATAMVPALVTRAADPAADAALLERLARWATRYTPLAATDGADALVLDIFGCAPLFGGEAALLDDAAARLARMGFAVCAAIAGTAAAALALARAGRHGVVVPPGGEFAAIAPLSVTALGLETPLCARLEEFGLGSIGALAAQPRAALARRLGPAVLAALDRALGASPAPTRPLAPPPDFAAACDFAEPITTAEAIAAALERLARDLCGRLARAGRGARRISLTCFRTDDVVLRGGIGTGLASRDERHLLRLLLPRIASLDPGFGIERMVLAAEVTERLGAAQSAFAEQAALRAARRAELAQLLDRLRAQLGQGAVHRLAPRASHVPERAVTPADPFVEAGLGPLPAARSRPVRLFDPPEPVSVVSLLPDGPPRRFRWRNRVIGVARAEGPERIAPEWWRGTDAPARDYWRVEAEEGGRLWLFRTDPALWFLHGLFG